MEFLRFGSNIPGAYWGCCACDIIQDFKQDPDEKASIQLVVGDSGSACQLPSGEVAFAGPTWKDIFLQRLRFGTFSTRDMPNHAFLAILTDWQITSNPGKKWLPILADAGFEFIRTINNSVYTGASDTGKAGAGAQGNKANYLFGLFRNIGDGHASNPFEPPKAWTELKHAAPQPYEHLFEKSSADKFVEDMLKRQRATYAALPKQNTLLSEKKLTEMGVPIWIAGKRGGPIQHRKSTTAPLSTPSSPTAPPTAG